MIYPNNKSHSVEKCHQSLFEKQIQKLNPLNKTKQCLFSDQKYLDITRPMQLLVLFFNQGLCKSAKEKGNKIPANYYSWLKFVSAFGKYSSKYK